jgi:hypothetical protein
MMATMFVRDLVKEGYSLFQDTREPALEHIRAFELVGFLTSQEEENGIPHSELFRRSKNAKAHLGQIHAEHLLAHPEMLSAEWHEFLLLFPGTTWVSPLQESFIPCLRWDLEAEVWKMHMLVTGRWYSNSRLLCARLIS